LQAFDSEPSTRVPPLPLARLVRRLRKYRKTPRSSIDSPAVLACLATLLTPVFNAACDLKPHQASPPAFCLTRRSWPSSWRLVDAWTLGSEALSVQGRGRATKAALSDCSFACWRHAINPAHPLRRQKEKNALSDPVICRSSLWRRPSKACFDNPYHQGTRGTEVKDISIVKSTASESGAGATDCEMQYLEHPVLGASNFGIRLVAESRELRAMYKLHSIRLISSEATIILSGASHSDTTSTKPPTPTSRLDRVLMNQDAAVPM
jgi:hypothetical protein